MSEEVKVAVVEEPKVEETPEPKPKKVKRTVFDVQMDLHNAVVAHKQDPSKENEEAVKAVVKELHRFVVKKKKR